MGFSFLSTKNEKTPRYAGFFLSGVYRTLNGNLGIQGP